MDRLSAPSILSPLMALLALASPAAAACTVPTGVAADPALPFEVVRAPGADPTYVLGINRFSSEQLTRFLAGVEPFVSRAESVPPGQQLVWRVDGLRGYLSLSTSPFPDGPRYLMTLRGEPVRTFEDTEALLVTMTRLVLRVLAGGGGRPATTPGGSPLFAIP